MTNTSTFQPVSNSRRYQDAFVAPLAARIGWMRASDVAERDRDNGGAGSVSEVRAL